MGCDCSSLEVWEHDGQAGLHILEQRSEHVGFLELPSPDDPNTSVSHLSKIGSVTDWDQKRIENQIDGVILGRCKTHGH